MMGARQIAPGYTECFAAVGSPSRLDMGKVRLEAWLTINHEAARAGRAQPAGDVLLMIGSEREAEAAIVAARGLPGGGPFAVEFSPVLDAVRVARVADIVARGRGWLADGAPDLEGWYAVALGGAEHCAREATRLRRVRAGHRSREGRAV